MTSRWTLIGFAALLLVVVVAGGSTAVLNAQQGAPAKITPTATTPVRTQVATPVDSFLRNRVYTGTLVARRRSVLSFERAGKVVELVVDEGDAVTKGELLARLDTRRLLARRSRAEADLAEAMAVLRELVAGPRQQSIAAAAAEVRSLAAQRDVAERNLKRREQLVASNAVSREEYDEALYDYRAAAARTDVAQKNLDELEAGTRQEQIAAQEAQVSALEASVADILHELDDSVLLAPYAGRIAKRRVDEGTVVSPGAAVFELVEADTLEAWIGLPPQAAAQVEVGLQTTATIAGTDYVAIVQSVRPELDVTTRTQNVVLRLDSPAGLVAGQVVRVGVREPVAMPGFWVPTQALSPGRRGLWTVLVAEEGAAAARPVEVIEADGDHSFVRGALEAGEHVIVEGAHRIVAGQAVAAAPASSSNG
ncbi:Multidrug resistance protein MdtA precursor [Botrimarina colliarenosi]|uniref:Multidrug resistance protein MdtA n=1 Tax=Botrimarina colliarenosi TaxID=2528001 RepID=A0A5C6AHX9_9BACT|nr:efflux RND transporter periplasmic adaptor subunit [Botrimarina colliarenosi]TWT99239.1 Multidrug resistance protein MdtA precursor [Botrimarina colliarenosi]